VRQNTQPRRNYKVSLCFLDCSISSPFDRCEFTASGLKFTFGRNSLTRGSLTP
jgi:hypothetical protein